MISKGRYPIDVSEYEVCKNPIAGRYPKLGLKHAGKRFILKFPAYKQNGLEVPYHVSEYVASKVIKSLGYDVHDVWLAEFRGRVGCLLELFDEPLFTFGGLGTSTLSGENLPYDLDLLHSICNEGKFACDFAGYLWDTFLLDAFVINLDRHPNNWGFIKRKGLYYQAPLFDNASSLYSLYAFDLAKVADIEGHIKKFGNSKISYKGERCSFRQVLISEKSRVFCTRLEFFMNRLSALDMSFLRHIEEKWPKYKPYTHFVQNLIDRQVKWLETQL